MKLIVGLGNPGKEYEKTRHNSGFLAVDELAKLLNTKIETKDFEALISKINYQGETVILMKPQTYMNESGRAIVKAVNYYHLDITQDLLILYDDLDLPFGRLRLRENGSSGGHNGIKSIINCLNSQDFRRIRIGIKKEYDIDTINYVIGKIDKEHEQVWLDSINKAANAAKDYLNEPFQNVMNKYNKFTNG